MIGKPSSPVRREAARKGPATKRTSRRAADPTNKLKQFRAVATRYDKRQYMYYATVDIATIKIWLRDLTRDTMTQ